jgi:hypothetical protein
VVLILAPRKVLLACKELYVQNLTLHELIQGDGDAIRNDHDLRIRTAIRAARNDAISAAKTLMRID